MGMGTPGQPVSLLGQVLSTVLFTAGLAGGAAVVLPDLLQGAGSEQWPAVPGEIIGWQRLTPPRVHYRYGVGKQVFVGDRMAFGWNEEELEELIDNEVGILLTFVLPGTPAALAKLKPGDVIVRVNGRNVKGAEEFSEMLTKVGSGEDVKFTVERPRVKQSLSVEVKLGGAFQPVFEWQFEMPKVPRWTGGLKTLGIEAVTLSGKYISEWGGTGVLVVGVEPESAAARAGLKERDVIEMINGRVVGRGTWPFTYRFNSKEKHVLSVVRHKEKKQLVIEPVE